MSDGVSGTVGLVADVGGTHLRMALARKAEPAPLLSAVEEIAHGYTVDLAGAVADYLRRHGRVAWAVMAAAGPVESGAVSLTNARGQLTEAGLSQAAGGAPAKLINDFAALALSAPALGAGDLHALGSPAGVGEGTVVVMGPGTGLGVAALVRDGTREAVASGEGGHIGFAPTDEVEVEVWRYVTARYGRCSLERLICGQGLVTLHEALHAGGAVFETPAALVAAAQAGDAAADATVERFCGLLGSAAGDAALMLGARGGVLIGGGVAPRLLAWLDRGGFRARFEAKGRFEGYMRALPTAVITHPYAALLGAARAASG